MSYPNIINEINKVNISKVTYSDALFLGDVRFNTDSSQISLKSTKDNIQFNINGGTAYNRGAWIALEGCDNTSGNFPAGSFNIRATNSSGDYCDFRGTAEGKLSWNSSDIITSAGGTITENELIIDGYGNKVAQLRLTDGNDDAVMFRLDGESLWILLANGDRFGGYNNHRPIRIHCPTGNVYINGGLAVGKVSERVGTTWYRKYSDGWIEQGGSATSEITGNASITFPIAFSNTNYYLSGVGYVIASVSRQSITSKTTTGFTTGSHVSTWSSYFWYACGY